MKPISRARMKGFTLVELMVAITVLALLITLAYPSYTTFIQNAQIRSAAESVINGLQLARAEAIRNNQNVQFSLENTSNGAAITGGTDWSVKSGAALDQTVQARRENSTSSLARVGVRNAVSATAAAAGAGLPANIVFTGLGRLSTATTVRQIDITGASGARRLAIVLTPGGDVRLCDPLLSLASNPQGCS
ncbi:MAG: GspH/FimT family pseudopilin [Variovorax sp.]|nr:GspH/FimT family pseudopilin [Variovorax sp.]